jgi:polygalacturonase
MEIETGIDIPIPMPTFPLNTDGIDFYGRNATFRRLKIVNFDDTVVPKPSSRGSWGSDCTQDILVEDCEVTYGVGMTIGTVVPNKNCNCIKNVVFRNINFHRPLKAIYIKNNPGTGTGLIQNITYENIYMKHPVWWGLYIGLQQQKQPGGGGPGCMLYPLTSCGTQPLVPINDITLRNITSVGSILPAGIIRCNETNPCHGYHFEDVSFKSFVWDILGYGFISENIYGTAKNVHPDPKFLVPGTPLPAK